jgi:hypothetical protein
MIRYATEDEIRAAGHEITGTYAPRWELPHPVNQGEPLPRPQQVAEVPQRAGTRFVRILGEFDFHIVVLYVALAIPVFGIPLSPWIRIGIGLLAPQGRILSHASDLRSRAEPSWAYLLMNEVVVVVVVGAYAVLR